MLTLYSLIKNHMNSKKQLEEYDFEPSCARFFIGLIFLLFL